MLSLLRERLRQAVSQIPFAFPPALEILEEDGFFLSRLLEGFARRFDLPEKTISGAAFVFELVRTTLTVHTRVSRERSEGREKFFENDKLAILAGDDLFTRALAEIPKIGNPTLEAAIHLSITEACREHLLASLGSRSESRPILKGVLMVPALAQSGSATSSADLKTLEELANAFEAKNGAGGEAVETIDWLAPFFSKNISPFARGIVEVFSKEVRHSLT